jgi:hypothetical protein
MSPDLWSTYGPVLAGAVIGSAATLGGFWFQSSREDRHWRQERRYEALLTAASLLRRLGYDANELSLSRSTWAWIFLGPRRYFFPRWDPLVNTIFELAPRLGVLRDEIDDATRERYNSAVDRLISARARNFADVAELTALAVQMGKDFEARARKLVGAKRHWWRRLAKRLPRP